MSHVYKYLHLVTCFIAVTAAGCSIFSSKTLPDKSTSQLGPFVEWSIDYPEDSDRYIFYTEQTSTVRMDLTDSDAPLTAVAVDTRRPYEEIDIGSLTPEAFTWNAPRTSDWVIAVSDN